MSFSPPSTRGVPLFAGLVGLVTGLTAADHLASAEPRDPLAAAVIDSLASTPRSSPRELLEAVIRATEVEAFDVAMGYLARLQAALPADDAARTSAMAELADLDPPGLLRTERLLAAHEPDARGLLTAIQDASIRRRRDPAWLTSMAKSLTDETVAARTTAFDQLARASIDALPAIVEVLTPPDDADEPRRVGRALAWRLAAELGERARQPLLAWLGSDDVPHWPGIIRALDACGTNETADFLLAPMLVRDSPVEVSTAAAHAYARLMNLPPDRLPSRTEAVHRLSNRLADLLTPIGLAPAGLRPAGHGQPDVALEETVMLSVVPAQQRGIHPDALSTQFIFDPEKRSLVRAGLTRRLVRGIEAGHLARDLMALGARDSLSVRLALLARLEGTMLTTGAVFEDSALPAIRESLTGPDGFDPVIASEVLDEARERDMHHAAAGAIRGIVEWATPDGGGTPLPIAPMVRDALVRVLDAPDLHLRYLAAAALAELTGRQPFAGSSRVVETLVACAASTGTDRVVIAHPERAAAVMMETGLARHGFTATIVTRGTDAVAAARHCDTRLVLLAARLGDPGPLEVAQLVGHLPSDERPTVLIVIDPMDDAESDPLRRRLQLRLHGYEGESLSKVAITDRLSGLFETTTSADTGETIAEPRLRETLEHVGGDVLLLEERRRSLATARRDRGDTAMGMLAAMAARGFDVSDAVPLARRMLASGRQPERCLAMLSANASAMAQEALVEAAFRPTGAEASRQAAAAALEASLDTFGLLLDDVSVTTILRRYNEVSDPGRRAVLASLSSRFSADATSTGTNRTGTASGPAAAERR